jgi:nucleoside-diphosphate-sugar epimerase
MRYFVTGATGFIGAALVRQLRAQGHDVVALVRSPQRAARLEGLGATLCQGDVTDRASLERAMAGVDGVFHVAGWYKLDGDRRTAHRVNVVGTRNVLETMRDMRVPRGVYTSTLAVHSDTRGRLVDETYRFKGTHLTEYDDTKWRAHYEVALPMIRAGLPLVLVQPGLVYGPGDQSPIHDMFVRFLAGKLPLVPTRTAYCWAHIDDIACGHRLAMERGAAGEAYHLPGPAHTLTEVFQIATRLTGLPPPRAVPPGLLRVVAAFLASLDGVVSLPATIHPESLRAAAGVTYLGDGRKAERDLGFAPRPLEAGLRETLAALARL